MASMIEPTGKYVITDDNHYKQIAETIRSKTGQANTYTPSQMPSGIEEVYDKGKADGKAITNDATASASDILYGKSAYVNGEKIEGAYRYKKFTCEVLSDVVGKDAYVVLSDDEFFLEHRTDENLSIVITVDVENQVSAFVKAFCFNQGGVLFGWGSDDSSFKQYRIRYNHSGVKEGNPESDSSLCADSPIELKGVYSTWISPEGELRIYPLSDNYILRAGTYTVEVRW